MIGLNVTSGDVYDSVPYLEQIEHIHKNVIHIQAATADSAYDFPLAHRVLEEQGIDFFVRPQPVHDRTSVELKRDAFSHDEAQDVYLCPNGKHLKLNSLHRSASGLYWVYLADKQDCRSCPLRTKCLGDNDKRGAQKWGHNLTRILRRGLEAAEDHCLLSATALNLKRIIKSAV